jgi:predicted dehydrogenase
MKKIKVGIIGAGGIARDQHIPAYQKLKDVEIVAICDVLKDRAEEVGRRFGIPRVFSDYRKLLKMDEIDAVSVCTPNFMHKAPTVAALEAGKHVLCEKPIAMNAREGRAMVEAAKRAKKKFMIGFHFRFKAETRMLKRLIDEGACGKIYHAKSSALRRRGIPSWGVFTQKDKSGGGPLIDIGVHVLDLTLYLMNHPKPVAVSGQTYQAFGKRKGVFNMWGPWDHSKYDVEDYALGLVRFADGATLFLETSWAANIGSREIFNCLILGDKGGVEYNPPTVYSEKSGSLLNEGLGLIPKEDDPHAQEVAHFIDCIRTGSDPIPTGEHGLMAMEIIDAIYASSKTGREVKLRA